MDIHTSYNYLIAYLEELLDFYSQSKIKVIKAKKKNLVLWITKTLIKNEKM